MNFVVECGSSGNYYFQVQCRNTAGNNGGGTSLDLRLKSFKKIGERLTHPLAAHCCPLGVYRWTDQVRRRAEAADTAADTVLW